MFDNSDRSDLFPEYDIDDLDLYDDDDSGFDFLDDDLDLIHPASQQHPHATASQEPLAAAQTKTQPAAPTTDEATSLSVSGTVSKKVQKPAEERIADLFESMPSRRKILLDILDFCLTPVAVEEVNAHIDLLQEHHISVYSPANLCNLLERAGALERIDAEGKPAQEGSVQPEETTVDGIRYLTPAEPRELFWVTSEAGRAALDADKPLERLQKLLSEDAFYVSIYRRILNMCTACEGASIKELSLAVDDDPLVQKPRLYAPHFVDRLEKCDALEWRAAWFTTEIGKAGLTQLNAQAAAGNTDNATDANIASVADDTENA